MRRLLAVVAGVAAVVAVVLAPPRATPDDSASYLRVRGATLACPELAVTDDSASVLTGLVAPPAPASGSSATAGPGGAAGTATQGTTTQGTGTQGSGTQGTGSARTGTQGTGSAGTGTQGTGVLRPIDSQTDLARIPGVGDPLNLLVAKRTATPILMLATGGWAPDALAGVASHELGGAGAGIASAACPAPGSDWWFVGSGSQLGRGAALLVSNPAPDPARFDISLYAASGPVEALAGKGIDLGPQSFVRLRLDALAQDQALLAVRVRATAGRVAAALRDVAVPEGSDPRGVDFVPPAIAPSMQAWIGGIPGGASHRSLVLVNPGNQFATVKARLLTAAGTQELGSGPFSVPAGSVTSTSLDDVIPTGGGTLELTSDVPVTGAVESAWSDPKASGQKASDQKGSEQKAGAQDVSWLSATPPITVPNTLAGAAAVPAGEGIDVSVTVSAPASAVSGVLTVIGTGSAADSIFSDTEAFAESVRKPTSAPSPSPAPSATPGREIEVITADSAVLAQVQVDVRPGAIREVPLPQAAESALVHLVWRSAEGSGPAIVSHLAVDPQVPLATGYSWWPTQSAVAAVGVREDIGVLAPTD